jgi:hypothetical protein
VRTTIVFAHAAAATKNEAVYEDPFALSTTARPAHHQTVSAFLFGDDAAAQVFIQ